MNATNATPREKERDNMNYTCDIVVVGSGGAGMVAAGHAAASGAKVIVLEKNKLVGGNTWFAVGTRYINEERPGKRHGRPAG